MENPQQKSSGSSEKIDVSTLLGALYQDETICKLRILCGLTAMKIVPGRKMPCVEMMRLDAITKEKIVLPITFNGEQSTQEAVTFIREAFKEIIETPFNPDDIEGINYTNLSSGETNESLLHQFILQYEGDHDLAYKTFPIRANPLTQAPDTKKSSEQANIIDLDTWLEARKALRKKIHACGEIECFWQSSDNIHIIHRIGDTMNKRDAKDAAQSIRRIVLQESLRKALEDEPEEFTKSIGFINAAEDGSQELTRDGESDTDDDTIVTAFLVNAPTLTTDRFGRVTDESGYEFQNLCVLLREAEEQHGNIQVLVNKHETENPLEERQNPVDQRFERKVRWFLPAPEKASDPQIPDTIQEVEETIDNNSLCKELMNKLEERLSSEIFESISVTGNDVQRRAVSLKMSLKRRNGEFSMNDGLDKLCFTIVETFHPSLRYHLQVIKNIRVDRSTMLVTVKLQVAKKKKPQE